jgi:hypothetical protein
MKPFPVRPPPSGVRVVSPSVPALANDVELETDEYVRTRFRKGSKPWALIGVAALVAAVIATFAVMGRRSSPPASPSSANAVHEKMEMALERERALRASRAAGQWVEIPQDLPQRAPAPTAAPCDSSRAPAPGNKPCAPRAKP